MIVTLVALSLVILVLGTVVIAIAVRSDRHAAEWITATPTPTHRPIA